MPSRCLNRVMLIGNLTRDPELRYTPAGMAVSTFGLATNRVWSTKQGERKEDAQFHRIVAWNKLGELCAQLLKKGRRIYVEGRIQYREFSDNEGQKKMVAEIVIDDMIILENTTVGMENRNVSTSGEMTSGPEEVTVDEAPSETEEIGGIPPLDDVMIPDEAVEDKVN